MKLAIIGTRTPSLSYTEWEKRLKEKINLDNVTLIVSGGAKGIDTYAKLFAARHHIRLMEFLPQYATYGKKCPSRSKSSDYEGGDLLHRVSQQGLAWHLSGHQRSGKTSS